MTAGAIIWAARYRERTGGLLLASWSEMADKALLLAAVTFKYHWPKIAMALEREGHGGRTAQACEHRLRLAGLIASAQAVEHYEISRYGTLKAWAEQLGLQQAVSLLDETLEEEKKTDGALTELAKAAVNQEAQQAAE